MAFTLPPSLLPLHAAPALSTTTPTQTRPGSSSSAAAVTPTTANFDSEPSFTIPSLAAVAAAAAASQAPTRQSTAAGGRAVAATSQIYTPAASSLEGTTPTARGFPVIAMPTPTIGLPPRHVRMADGRVPRGRLTLALSAALDLPNNAATERRVNAAVRFVLWYGRVPTDSDKGRSKNNGATPATKGAPMWGMSRATSAVVRGQPISAIAFSSVTGGGSGGGGSEDVSNTALGSSRSLFGGPTSSSSGGGTTPSSGSTPIITRCESVLLTVCDVAHVPSGNSRSRTPLPWLVYTIVSPGLWGEEVLATGALSIGSLFSRETAGRPQRVEFPLIPHKRTVGPASVAPMSGQLPRPRLVLDACFHPMSAGVLVLTLHEARNLTNRAYVKQDPYVAVTCGGGARKVRSCIIKRGGTDVTWSEEVLQVWVGPESWATPIDVAVFDHDKTTGDDIVGRCQYDPVAWLGDCVAHEETVNLGAPDGPAGVLTLTRRFYPAGELVVRIIEGRNLKNEDPLGSSDPYAELSIVSAFAPVRVTTKTDARGGAFPSWDQLFRFDVVDAPEMRLRVRDRDTFTRDDDVGEVVVDLGAVYRWGLRDAWVPIKKTTSWGERVARGEVHLEVSFVGAAPSILYPQLCLGVTAFDATERRKRPLPNLDVIDPLPEPGAMATTMLLSTPGGSESVSSPIASTPGTSEGSPMASTAAPGTPSASGGGGGDDGGGTSAGVTLLTSAGPLEAQLNEHDAAEAFAALDVKGKRYLGAAELKHMLICMGELVTNGEVDEMIRMLDADGDGQVSFDEFKRMAMDDALVPSHESSAAGDATQSAPAAAPSTAAAAPGIAVQNLQGGTVQVVGTGADAGARRTAMHRATELVAKSRKKAACEAFVGMLSLRLHEVHVAARRATAMSLPSGGECAGFMATFPELCHMFGAPRTTESETLFSAFVKASDGSADTRVDAREVLIALTGFMGATRTERAKFCIELFDGSRHGGISQGSLVAILRATHLAYDDASVERKVATLMAAADAPLGGRVGVREFEACAQRYANLLFPDVR